MSAKTQILAVDFDHTITYSEVRCFEKDEVLWAMGGVCRTARMLCLFHDLCRHGVTIYVVSLNRGDVIGPFLHESGLAPFVSCVYDGERVKASGSKQLLVRHLMRTNAVGPTQCLMVDDEPSNIADAPCWSMPVPLKHGIDDDIDRLIRAFFWHTYAVGVAPPAFKMPYHTVTMPF